MATAVNLTYSSNADLFRAQVDGKTIKFVGGKATINVTSGVNHALQWFVRGAPGSKYTIEITAPKPSVFKHQATLDADRMDAGHTWVPA